MKRGDLKAVAALCLGWLALFLYIDPRGDFPLNDDFQYAEAVRRWASGGGFRLSQWGLSTSVTHIVLGRILSLLVSPTNWHLRLLMMCVGLFGAILFYYFLRGLGLERTAAAAGAGVLACNPIYLTMSASFHLDVTATALLVAAAWAFTAALRKNSASAMALCSLLVGLGLLTRQTAAFSIFGGLVVLWRRKLLKTGLLVALLLPAAACAAGFWIHLHSLPELPWAWRTQVPSRGLAVLFSPRAWRDGAVTMNLSLRTLGLALLPLVVGQIRREDWTGDGRAAAAAMLFLLPCLLLAGLLADSHLPALGNTLTLRGLGVVTLTAPEEKAAGIWGHWFFWRTLDLLGMLAIAAAVFIIFGRRRPARRGEALSEVLLFGLPPYLSTLLFSENFDRYLLAALPFLIAAVLLQHKRPLRPAAFAGWCLALAAVSAVGLRDYFAWNRARWEAGQYLVGLGVPPGKIENGFDWDGQFTLDRDMTELLAAKPAAEIGMWDWMKLNRVVAITSFSDRSPLPSFLLLKRIPYASPLAPGGGFVYLYGDKRVFTPKS